MPAAISEKMVTEAWQSLLTTGNKLVTETGQTVEVVYPGKASDAPGSDFQDAVIQINRQMFKGNIELHVKSSDWHAHGHDRNPAYNNVVLHVALQRDCPGNITLQNGAVVPAVTIDRFLQIGPETVISQRVPCAGIGFNQPERLLSIIERAGAARFYAKAAQFQKQLQNEEPAQCLYSGIMTALGYAKNKEPFQKLAAMVPLAELQLAVNEDTVRAQALLFGTAGLLPSQRPECDYAPLEDYAFAEALENQWEALARTDVLNIRDWQPFRVRPANSPLRRMMGMILLLERYGENGLLNGLLALVRNVPAENVSAFLQTGFMTEDDGGYWSARYDFGKGYAALSKWLIGESRADDIVINVLLPFYYVFGTQNGEADLAEKALAIFRKYPASETNTIVRHMKAQFSLKNSCINSALRQQGLLHLYKQWCTQGRCGECEVVGKS